MKNLLKTILDTLCERLREQAQRFNTNLEAAPAAVLWTSRAGRQNKETNLFHLMATQIPPLVATSNSPTPSAVR